jgi:pimeloyl-ACP methyl ester carboxylesterase
LRHGKYKSVAGAGHLIPMQKPKEVAQIIKEFLAD